MPLKLNQDELPTMNLTSMIDVLFLLIIFFMVGTRFTENETNININLAKVAPNGSMLSAPASKSVAINSDGSIQFENRRVTADELTAMLAQAVQNYPGLTVQIKPDGKVSMEQLAPVYVAINKSGAKIDGLAVAQYQMPGTRR